MKKAVILLFLSSISLFSATRSGPIGLRKKLHVNPLITDPDTIEVDWAGLFPLRSFPMAVRFTPEGRHLYWGRTEFSASFDLHARDQAIFAATCVLLDGEKFDIAVAPLLSVGNGTHAGGYAIARYDQGRSSVGLTGSWLAGTFDLGGGYGFQFAKHLTAHANWQWEKPQVSLFEGIEWQITNAIALDLSGQHQAVWGGPRDHQAVIALTISTPKLHRH